MLKELQGKLEAFEAVKKTVTASGKVAEYDARFGRYVGVVKGAIWGCIGFAAAAAGFGCWVYLSGIVAHCLIAVAGLVALIALWRAYRSFTVPQKVSELVIEEIENQMAPAKTALRLAGVVGKAVNAGRR